VGCVLSYVCRIPVLVRSSFNRQQPKGDNLVFSIDRLRLARPRRNRFALSSIILPADGKSDGLPATVGVRDADEGTASLSATATGHRGRISSPKAPFVNL
jgi:hypothetical protein